MKKYFVPVQYAVHRKTFPGWDLEPREIKNHELVLVTEGRLHIDFDTRRIELGAGELLYLKPDIHHYIYADRKNLPVFYGIHFELEEGALPLDEVNHPENWQKYLPLLEEIVMLWNRKNYLDDWELELNFSRFLMELIREEGRTSSPGSRRQVRKVIEWLHEHTDCSPAIAQLCGVAGMKKSYLIKNFKEITGQSPIQYSLSLRLERAKVLLLDGTDSVREIAYACGFRDEFYFSRMFRSRFGLSPTDFRKHA